jgi:DNA polymerase-3 subunit epsilon
MEKTKFDEVIEYIKANNIKVERPLAFLDLETTGIDVLTARIIQVGITKILPGLVVEQYSTLVNPGIPIPEEAIQVHHIDNDMVADAPKFADIANDITTFLDKCDIVGYNILHYDLPLLIEEFRRVGLPFRYGNRKLIDVYKLLVKNEPRDLKHTFANFTGKELEDAHDAQNDNYAAASIAVRQIEKYGLNDLDGLAKDSTEGMVDLAGFFVKDEKKGCVVFAKGKYAGRSVVEVYQSGEDAYYFENYIGKKCSSDTNTHLKLILGGRQY